MIITLENVISETEITEIQRDLSNAEFIDGKLTAGWHAKLVKNNSQLKRNSKAEQTLSAFIKQKLFSNPLFQAVSYPRYIHSLLISRYDTGMSYGRHVDNAFMGKAPKRRSDISFTVFLNNPEDYNGGELCFEFSDGEKNHKLSAGDAILYPSSTIHEVKEVTSGHRLVVVGWVESYIRDPNQRELLFDLDTAKRSLFQKMGKTIEFDLIAKTHSNLLRQWSN